MRHPGRSVAVLAATLALASAGCGKSKEEKLFEARREACLAGMELPIQNLLDHLGPNAGGYSHCEAADVMPPFPSDVCPGGATDLYTEPMCEYGWFWSSNDPSICSAVSCLYVCLARFTEADQIANGRAATVCATEFIRP